MIIFVCDVRIVYLIMLLILLESQQPISITNVQELTGSLAVSCLLVVESETTPRLFAHLQS